SGGTRSTFAISTATSSRRATTPDYSGRVSDVRLRDPLVQVVVAHHGDAVVGDEAVGAARVERHVAPEVRGHAGAGGDGHLVVLADVVAGDAGAVVVHLHVVVADAAE